MMCSSRTIFAESETESAFSYSTIGDVNDDDIFSSLDVKSLSNYMIDYEIINEENADFNADETLNIVDFILLKDRYLTLSSIASQETDNIYIENNSYEDRTINFKYLNVDYSVEFDSIEQKVMVNLNNFRQRYGIGQCPVFYRGLYACDMAASAGKNEVFSELHKHFIYRQSSYKIISSSDPDVIAETLMNNPLVKGSVLTPDYYVSVGHNGSLWVLMMSWIC